MPKYDISWETKLGSIEGFMHPMEADSIQDAIAKAFNRLPDNQRNNIVGITAVLTKERERDIERIVGFFKDAMSVQLNRAMRIEGVDDYAVVLKQTARLVMENLCPLNTKEEWDRYKNLEKQI